ncbi:aldo/keto reductase [Leptospira sp. 201903071]|uniref:aldo/keto reductase n=1 Tax=Leptospira ainazelensis TaxID=2810034 RepID=UPI001963DE5C|nr:aldo/keto reductase [Leptospira ainazelensis]MBM9500928.1 aldo/keto reductase [Leptospira ainazelensis]
MTSLGTQGLKTSRLGLGCMGMSEFYGTRDDSESLKTLRRAYELGITFWDTADMYGPYINEELLSLALKGIRSEITLATKFGIVRDPSDPSVRGYNGTPKYVQSSCEASLKRLKVETIDLYYMHRLDPNTPIEETVGAMGRLVEQGKIRYVGISEVNSDTLRKANAVYPISAIQNEYSLWSREPEDDILDTCKELGVGFVAYSPLGRGFLTGQIKRFEDFAPDDYRRMSPRFQGENFTKNLELVQKIESLARQKECKPSQLALAWVLTQGDNIVPIPGTKRIPYLEENFGALKVKLTENDLKEIDSIAPKGIAKGARYPEWKKNTVG